MVCDVSADAVSIRNAGEVGALVVVEVVDTLDTLGVFDIKLLVKVVESYSEKDLVGNICLSSRILL